MFDIITIGSAGWDVFFQIPESHIIKNPTLLHKLGFRTDGAQCLSLGSKLRADGFASYSGGGATNSAVAFSRLGLKTACVYKTGADIFGEGIERELAAEKVTSFRSSSSSLSTDFSSIIIASHGSRTVLVHRGAASSLSARDLKNLNAPWFYLNPSGIPFSVINTLTKNLRRAGSKIAFAPSREYLSLGIEKLKPLLNRMAAVFLNREEASFLTSLPYNQEEKLFEALDAAIEGVAVMTEGARGVIVSDGRLRWRAGIFKNQHRLDRTGAGDAFGAGFVSGLIFAGESCTKSVCNDQNIRLAIRLGSANAGSVVERLGAKAGLLTKREFTSAARWKRLSIKKRAA